MEKQGYRGIMLLLIFLWAGMILGISFLEAPLKFQAPNVTLGIGLGIGRLVFGALNKIELLFSIILIVLSFITRPSVKFRLLLGLLSMILLFQTTWLLPALDERAQIIIDGRIPSGGSPHIIYVVAEIIKLVSLISAGIIFFNNSLKYIQKEEVWKAS
ncbi:hypothetical protein MYP_3142 [Sporocytophaga myxococcoides]|uniref:DUF4149 domain-containing protein n=1 Tax=Sporocytophaga myxococcoides TaxID=153721 RepID=A0A098LIE7_9BACT|nr:hypothetical protein [Sporocytophaga myxococcoides]GAL85913.1 hypothetical protein MYP_3142 [Sporocytophaga myxococcoides]